jgi:cytochrome P450
VFYSGHGKHACPGRFLASTELKIALSHMLLKYDWKLDKSDTMPRFFSNETAHMTNPGIKLMARRRKEEISLDLDVDPYLIDVQE